MSTASCQMNSSLQAHMLSFLQRPCVVSSEDCLLQMGRRLANKEMPSPDPWYGIEGCIKDLMPYQGSCYAEPICTFSKQYP